MTSSIVEGRSGSDKVVDASITRRPRPGRLDRQRGRVRPRRRASFVPSMGETDREWAPRPTKRRASWKRSVRSPTRRGARSLWLVAIGLLLCAVWRAGVSIALPTRPGPWVTRRADYLIERDRVLVARVDRHLVRSAHVEQRRAGERGRPRRAVHPRPARHDRWTMDRRSGQVVGDRRRGVLHPPWCRPRSPTSSTAAASGRSTTS